MRRHLHRGHRSAGAGHQRHPLGQRVRQRRGSDPPHRLWPGLRVPQLRGGGDTSDLPTSRPILSSSPPRPATSIWARALPASMRATTSPRARTPPISMATRESSGRPWTRAATRSRTRPPAVPATSPETGSPTERTLTRSSPSGASRARTCPGDLSGDNRVDGADLALILVGWGPCF